jgi:hypothetical protein
MERTTAQTVRIMLEEYVEALIQLEKEYKPLMQKAITSASLKKVLLLWHYHSQLLQLSKFIDQVKEKYFTPREDLLDSRTSALQPYLLNEITADSYLYKEFGLTVSQLISLLESLLNTVSVALNLETDDRVFGTLAADIRGMCSDISTKTAEMPTSLEHHLKFLQLRRNIQESNSLWTLSVLASIFLPLSLASSVLSMQTRFVDLHYLLYDFCGVIVLLLTLVAVILLMVKLSLSVTDKLAEFSRSKFFKTNFFKIYLYPLVSGVLSLVALSIWVVILSSFIVGMSQDVGLGGRILGFGIAGLTGIGIIACIIGFFVY